MNNLSRITTLLLLSVTTIQANSQSFLIKGGISFSNVNVSEDMDIDEEILYRTGFNIGVVMQRELSDYLDFETGVVAKIKGFRTNIEEGDFYYKTKLNTIYLDIPANFRLFKTIGSDKSVYIKAGPYLGIALSAIEKYKIKVFDEIETDTESYSIGNGEDDGIRRIDYGFSLGTGIEVNRIQFEVSYNHGIANLIPADSQSKVSNKTINVGLGYRLGN